MPIDFNTIRGTTVNNFNTGGAGGTEGTGGTGGVGGGLLGGTGNVPGGEVFGSGGTGGSAFLRNSFGVNENNGNDSANRLGDSQTKLSDAELKTLIGNLLTAIKDPDMLAKLLIEFSSIQRQQALDARLLARAEARADLQSQADQTREAAVKQLAAAVMSFVFAVVSAGIAIGGAASAGKQIKGAMKGAEEAVTSQKIADTLGDMGKTTQQGKFEHLADASKRGSDIALRQADRISQLASAFSGISNALGGLFEGTLGAAAKMDEARGQEFAAAAQDKEMQADMAKKFMDELEEMIKSALQFLKEMAQTQADMMATASRL